MSQWAIPAVAVLLVAYGAVSGRLLSTPVSQAMGVRRPRRGHRQPGPRPGRGRHGRPGGPPLIIFLTIAEAEEGVGNLHPLRVIREEIGFGVVAGALGAWVLRSFGSRGWVEGTWRQINAVATPLLAYTVAAALGGSGFIAAFTAGIVFRTVAADHVKEAMFMAEQTGELRNAVTFLLFGAVLLGPALGELDWPVAAYAVASLTVVRMLPVALALAGTGMRRATVEFLGWFGPRGLASIVFVLILLEATDSPSARICCTW